VAGLSDFNQFLFEANERNRMEEALDLFEEICNDSCYDASIKFFLVKFLARNHASAAHCTPGLLPRYLCGRHQEYSNSVQCV
jgi:hypothetical protein